MILIVTTLLLFNSSSFAANTKLIIDDVECYYSEEFTINAQLLDENDTPLESEELEINIDGWINNLYTDSEGKVSLTVPFDSDEIWYDTGTYSISTKFSGSNNNGVNIAKNTLTVLPMPISIKMENKMGGNGNLVVFSIFDKNGNPVGSERVNLFINGRYYNYVITNEYGTVSTDISYLTPGKYTITVNNYNVANNYAKDEVSMKVIIKRKKDSGSIYNIEHKGTQVLANMKNAGLPIPMLIVSIFAIFLSLFIFNNNRYIL